MSNSGEYTNLEQLLSRILDISKEADTVYLDDILNAAGQKSFGTILLLAGIITLAPLIGDIPGVPTTMGLIVFLIAIQMLLRRKNLWLPDLLLKRSIKQKKLQKAMKWLMPAARFIDRFLKPRLTILTGAAMVHVIAMICVFIALVMPVMEFIPFSANIAGIALTTFGLALLARDGLLALIAYFTTCMIVVFIVYRFI